jgi:hypothetical protein
MKRIHLFLIAMLALYGSVVAQSYYTPYGSAEKPEWADKMISEDLEYSYLETVMVRDSSQNAVRNEAKKVIAQRRQLTTGEVMLNTNARESSGIIVSSRLISEYWEYDGAYFRGYFLFQTRKNRNFEFERIRITTDYAFSPRVLVPGMAQLYKGSTTKGVLFIAGEVALIGGIIVTESLRASYESKINTTHNANDKQTYIDNADNMTNICYTMIGGAVAVYAWSLIDGMVAKGKMHVLIGSTKLQFAPYATSQSGGLALVLKF